MIILNEYDLIVNHSPYIIQHQAIKGIWQLRGHRVIAFTATSSTPYERLVNNCIAPPVVLKFKSEYELLHDIAPVSDPTVIPCADAATLHAIVCQDIDKHYEKHPVIIIANEGNRIDIVNHLAVSKFKFTKGREQNTLADIRAWDYGVLVLSREEGRGVDTRFRKDAIVLITCEVGSYHEL